MVELVLHLDKSIIAYYVSTPECFIIIVDFRIIETDLFSQTAIVDCI